MRAPMIRGILVALDWLALLVVSYVLLAVLAAPLLGGVFSANPGLRNAAPVILFVVAALFATMANRPMRRRLFGGPPDADVAPPSAELRRRRRRRLALALIGLLALSLAAPFVLSQLLGRGGPGGDSSRPLAVASPRPASGVAGASRTPTAAPGSPTVASPSPAVVSTPTTAASADASTAVPPTAAPAPTSPPAPAPTAAAATSPAGCTFAEPFVPLVQALGPEEVGECAEAARAVQPSGNLEQRTARGLLVWLREDNVAAFSTGAATAYRCPDGSVERTRAGEPFRCGRTVVLADDFEDPAVGSLQGSSPLPALYESGYRQGEYVLWKLVANWPQSPAVPLPGRHADSVIRLDARLVGETQNRYVVIACRDQGIDSNYKFLVAPGNGTFALTRWDAGRQVDLVGWQAADAIKRGNETNRLELVCVGRRIAAIINGAQVASVEDATYPQGQILLLVSHAANVAATVEARFDNLIVIRP